MTDYNQNVLHKITKLLVVGNLLSNCLHFEITDAIADSHFAKISIIYDNS